MPERTPLIQIQRSSTGVGGDPGSAEGHLPGLPAPSVIPRWEDVVQRMRAIAGARAATPTEAAAVASRCEFCGVEIDEAHHGHLVDVPQRALLCVCRPCYLLFIHEGSGGVRFRAVPDRYLRLSDAAAGDEICDMLQVPIGLAFFFTNGETGRTTAFYPSPAGATESELPLDAWNAIVSSIPPLSTLAPDVEALLVRRAEQRTEALIVPIDACYELVGRIRRGWRGFHGGDDMWLEIDEFFARAIERATEGAR